MSSLRDYPRSRPRDPIAIVCLTVLLAGCAGSGGGMPDPSVQYPIAGLGPPPYAVREERLNRPDPEADPAAARGYTGAEPSYWANQPDPSRDDPPREEDGLPPPPTFNSLADCEQAYGRGQCRTGDEIFSRHAPGGTPLPAPIARSYMPEAYGSMTGALAYGYLSPPGAYMPGLPYQHYVSPIVIRRYQVITPIVIQRYRSAPIHVRESEVRRGPQARPHQHRPHPWVERPPHARPATPPRAAAPARPPSAPQPPTRLAPPSSIPAPQAPGRLPPSSAPRAVATPTASDTPRPAARPAPSSSARPAARPTHSSTPRPVARPGESSRSSRQPQSRDSKRKDEQQPR